ncbi:MAG: hypothetical protein ACTHU0_10160 [Kofleriaceae bacterium]
MRTSRALALGAAVAAAACQGKKAEPSQAPAVEPAGSAGSAKAAASDWRVRCATTLRDAPRITPVRRIQALIDGCQPCGDWTPVVRWATPVGRGGPTIAAIAERMNACNAFCNGTARQPFLGTIEDARDKGTRAPWRLLADACKGEVGAEPDGRYLSGPYFALDRIARATAAEPELAPLAAAIELPLPPVSSNGEGFELASAPVTKPTAGPAHLTVTAAELRIGVLPRAKLGATGLIVEAGATPYPGAVVDRKALGPALDAIAGGSPIAVIAPAALPARHLIDAIAAAAPRPLVLAVHANGAPPGWSLPGHVPVLLSTAAAAPAGARTFEIGASANDVIAAVKAAPAGAFAAPPALVIGEQATVATIATCLGVLAFRDVPAVVLLRAAKS